MKIQTKTTILFTILTATIFLILNITVYYFINSFAHRDFNKRLELRARISTKLRFERNHLSTMALADLQRQYLEKLPEEEAVIVPIDPKNNRPLTPLPKKLPLTYLNEVATANGNTVFSQSRYRHFAGLRYNDSSGSYLVIESAANTYGSEMMRRLRLLKAATFVSAVVLIYTVGLYFSRKTFQPIREIINKANQISQGNLHLRLQEREGADELAELTTTFNQMLNRLETAFEAQNNFLSNASHELRTPLTAIVGEADYALSRERDITAYQYSLQQIADQAEKLQQVTKGLLALAQTGFSNKVQSWKKIRLDQLLFDVKETCDSILPDNQVCVDLHALPDNEESIIIEGNYDLLKVAINNIVINACKYSGNKRVDLGLSPGITSVGIVVRDRGIGIPANELPYIYDPFFRASNTTDYEGYGIGMPLSNNIIRLHKGHIQVHSQVNRGTEVLVILPL